MTLPGEDARKHRGLGRGLDTLLRSPGPTAPASADRSLASLPVSMLQAGRYQPRTRMDETALEELAASIRIHGVMQPILVRVIAGGRHEIIAGERRFRAAKLAGLASVPVIVREVDDKNALAMALIENIQREDLNPLEEAQAIKRLIEEFGYTHEQASGAIGRSRSATSNLLRLLNLADPVQTMLLAGELEMGHARALLALNGADQARAADRVVERGLTVRDTERLVAQMAEQPRQPPDGNGATGTGGQSTGALLSDPSAADAKLRKFEALVARRLGTAVRIKTGARGRGELVIGFDSAGQLESLQEVLRVALGLDEDEPPA